MSGNVMYDYKINFINTISISHDIDIIYVRLLNLFVTCTCVLITK